MFFSIKLIPVSSVQVEVCLTSNVRTESIPVIRDHHFGMNINFLHIS